MTTSSHFIGKNNHNTTLLSRLCHEATVIRTPCVPLQPIDRKLLVRDTLENYSAASNLMHNERVRELMAAGEIIYHFGFGQAPFPLMARAADRLRKHADKSAYLPVAGKC